MLYYRVCDIYLLLFESLELCYICLVDNDGVILKIYASSKEANTDCGIDPYCIRNCCRKLGKSRNKIFRYLPDNKQVGDKIELIIAELLYNSIKVCLIDTNGTVLELYDSYTEA